MPSYLFREMLAVTMTSTSTFSRGEQRLSPSRIRLARERCGLTKVGLAAALGVTTRVLQTYETDGAPPGRARELAQALSVEPQFFDRPECEAISVEQGFFRARRRATAAQLGSARAVASIGIEVYEWLGERFTLPEPRVPDLDHHEAEQAAMALRAAWGRGEEALPNLVQLSEAHGVRVMSLPFDADVVDAFSLWLDGLPYVFLSTTKSAERSRFDLAHELGHLVMHSRAQIGPDITERELEREADAFASALLMPRRALLAHAGREPAVPQILRLRHHYRVSAMAMAYRLHHLGRLTDWAYRQNCMELSRRGFRSAEPDGMDWELSRVFGAVFPMLRKQGTTPAEVAGQMGIAIGELHGLTFGQVPVPVPGIGATTATERPVLQVITGDKR